jgi:tRNA pseudouridine38-40 synthase
LRYRFLIEYAGTRYSGWQVQRNARTVQGEVNRALAGLGRGRPVESYGAGRTDAGVHALGQVAHVDLPADVPAATIRARTNDELPHDINILSVDRVPARFHARHSAVARSYLYQISRRRTAFAKPYVWWIRDPLDLEAMRQAAAGFRGFADFRAYTDDDPDEKSTQVLVHELTVAEAGDLVLVRVTGSHFLWRMVRRLVGVLADVGRGEIPAGDVARLVGADTNLPARLTAPASGLFLEQVFYQEPPLDRPLVPAVFSRV